MNIAIICGKFPSISETFVLQQVVGLIRLGHHVTVITLEPGDVKKTHSIYSEFVKHGFLVTVKSRKLLKFQKFVILARFVFQSLFSDSGWRKLFVVRKCIELGCKHFAIDIALMANKQLPKFDAIIAHFGPSGVIATLLKEAGILEGPVCTVFHGNDISDESTIAHFFNSYQFLFKNSGLLLPISELWKRKLETWGADPRRILVHRMSVYADVKPQNSSKALSRPLRVLSVGRFTEKKGLAYAIQGVLQAECNIEYRIVGGGELETELKRQAAAKCERSTISFLGIKTQDEVFQELMDADVFLLPSITASNGDMEGIPVALMEAMVRSVVVVTTNHSGIPELVQDKVSGFLVKERDSREIASILEQIVAGTFNLNEIRTAARAKVIEEFNHERKIHELVEICRRLEELN